MAKRNENIIPIKDLGDYIPDLEEYQERWTVPQLIFMVALATRPDLSFTKFSKEFNISTVTLWQWRKLPFWWPDTFKIMSSVFAPALYTIWAKVVAMAKKGDMAAIQLFLGQVAKIEDKAIADNSVLVSIITEKGINIHVHDDVKPTEIKNGE